MLKPWGTQRWPVTSFSLNRYRLTESAETAVRLINSQVAGRVSTAIDSLRVLKLGHAILNIDQLGCLNRYRLTESAETKIGAPVGDQLASLNRYRLTESAETI